MDAQSLNENESREMNLMDEDINDPDIEARLYAEIYYSNDTYPDINLEQEHGNDLQNEDPKAPDNSLWCIDPQPGKSNTQYRQSSNVHDERTQTIQYMKKTGCFQKRYRALLDGPIDNQSNSRNSRNRCGDWSPRNNSIRINRIEGMNQRQSENIHSLREMKQPERRRRTTKARRMIEEDNEPDRTSLTALDESLTSPEVQIPSRLEAIEPTPSSVHLSSEVIDENEEATEGIDENSKYKVAAKKVDENKCDPVDANESDSDASIFEVPVPPKPVPPLISLNDSDDESLSSDDESLVVVDNASSEQLKTSRKLSSSSSEASIIVDDSDESKDSTANADTDNLIINCTSVQKGFCSIDEIRRIRGNDGNHKIIGQSDEESMTESEAMNWKSLEGKIRKDKEFINPCESQIEYWNELSNDSESTSNHLEIELLKKSSNHVIPIRSEEKIDESEKIDKGTDEASLENNKRIRENERNEAVEIDEPAAKKKKHKEHSKEMSFQEYMFQPMPEQMVAFYNNPRGGEMMRDIEEIQNKMPKNPNCWAILDDDMHPSGRRTRTVCTLCQNEGHVRSKCPNRLKPPICHICGFIGHMEPRCPYNKQCINCGRKYGTCRKTCEMCNSLRCSQCLGKGHTRATCPDNWRKYHQTTSGTEPNIPKNSETILKPSNQLSCCNCTKRGHDAASCMKYRWSAHFIQKCYIKDYNQGPSYKTASTVQEYHQNINNARKVIDISHLGIDVDGPSSYLFHFVNWKPVHAEQWKEYRIIPNKLSGIDYPPPGATPIYPTFLKVQFNNRKCCPMEVIVKRSFEHNGLPEIIVKTPDSDSLERLKILILQWLIRCRADKDAQAHTEPLPQHLAQLLNYFNSKKKAFMKMKITKIGPDELNSCKSMEKLLISKNSYYKKRSELNDEEKRNRRKVKKLKTKFVIATYRIMLIGTVMDTFSCFMDFMKQLKQLNGTDVPGILYLTAVWYNFELFVPHISPAVVDAIKCWQESPIQRERGVELFKNKYCKGEKICKNQNPVVSNADTSTIPSLLSLNLSNATSLIRQDQQIEIGELSGNDKKFNENHETGESPENFKSFSDCIESLNVSESLSGVERNEINDLSSIEKNRETELEIEEIIPVTSNDQILNYDILVGKMLNNGLVIDNEMKEIQSLNIFDNNGAHLNPGPSKNQTPSSGKNKKRNKSALSKKMHIMNSKERKTVETNSERRKRKIAEKNMKDLGEIKMKDLEIRLRSKLTRIINEDSKLSIPNGMPVPRDPRVYNKIILRKKTNQTMKFIEEHNMEKTKKKMEEYMSKSKNGVVTKPHLIDIWTMIRTAMKKKIKINAKS